MKVKTDIPTAYATTALNNEEEGEEFELGCNQSDPSPQALASASSKGHDHDDEYEIWVPPRDVCACENTHETRTIRNNELDFAPGVILEGTLVRATPNRYLDQHRNSVSNVAVLPTFTSMTTSPAITTHAEPIPSHNGSHQSSKNKTFDTWDPTAPPPPVARGNKILLWRGLVFVLCVLVVVGVVVAFVTKQNPSQTARPAVSPGSTPPVTPAPTPLEYVKYEVYAFSSVKTNGSYELESDYQLKISCNNGGTLESFSSTSENQIEPECLQDTPSSITCNQREMTDVDGITLLVNARVYFECHGARTTNQLVAKATLSFQSISSSESSYSLHVVKVFQFNPTTQKYDYSGSECSKEWIGIEDETHVVVDWCGDESQCSFACTANLDEVTIVQSTPIQSKYILEESV